MELITLTDKEMATYEILQQVINGNLSSTIATDKLRLSDRQLRRLKAQVRVKGVQGVIHGNRCRVSNRRIDPETEENIVHAIKNNSLQNIPSLAEQRLNLFLEPQKTNRSGSRTYCCIFRSSCHYLKSRINNLSVIQY